MNSKNNIPTNTYDATHSILPATKKKRKHKHSRVPEETRKEVLMDFINNYEENENGNLTLKKGAMVDLSKKYKLHRKTIAAIWKKERKEPFHKNMLNASLQHNDDTKKQNDKNKYLKETNVIDHVEGALLHKKIEDLESKLMKQKDTAETMLNNTRLECEKVQKRYKVVYQMTLRQNDILSNENETLKEKNKALKEQIDLQQTSESDLIKTMKHERYLSLVENKSLDDTLGKIRDENDWLRKRLATIKSTSDNTELWKYIQIYNVNRESMPPLMNYGNSCYINVAIQMILMVFYDYLILVNCLISENVLKKKQNCIWIHFVHKDSSV